MNRLKQLNRDVLAREHAYCVQQINQCRPQNGQTMSLYDEALETGQRNYTKDKSKTCNKWRIPMKNKSLIFLMLMLIMLLIPTMHSEAMAISVGDYVYYPIDTEASYTETVSTNGSTTFDMNTKFGSTTPVFRVLAINDGKVVLVPADSSQVFSLSLYGRNGYFNGKKTISIVSALYANDFSESVVPITQAQMAAHTSTTDLNTLFSSNAWILDGWTYYASSKHYGRVATSSGASNMELLDAGGGSDYNQTRTANVIPAITLKSSVAFRGEGTETAPYTIIDNDSNIEVGDYIYYPVDTNANYSVSNVGVNQSFDMSSKFGNNTPIFRVIEIRDGQVIIAPDDLEEVFSLSLKGVEGYNKGKNTINAVATIYDTDYSSSVVPITETQILSNASKPGFNTLFPNDTWITDGWYGYANGHHYSKVVNSGGTKDLELYDGDTTSSYEIYTRSAYVVPAITLNKNVTYTGQGTKENPFSISLEEKPVMSVGDYVYYPIDKSASYTSGTLGLGNTQTFNMNTKFGSTTPVFRILEITDDGYVILCPDNAEEVFTLSLRGLDGFNGGPTTINAINNLYMTKYSESTDIITLEQMQEHINSKWLSELFLNYAWSKDGWDNTVYNHLNTYLIDSTSKDGKEIYDQDDDSSAEVHTVTSLVIPTIKLKLDVTLIGEGTEENPYRLNSDKIKIDEVINISTLNPLYIKSADKAKIILFAKDAKYNEATLTINDIVFMAGEETIVPSSKSMSGAIVTDNGLEWVIDVSGVPGNGVLSLKVPLNKIYSAGEASLEQVISTTTIDNIPPSDISVLINDGAQKTDNKDVMLSISAVGANYIYINNTGIAPLERGDYWTEYATSRAHELIGNLGTNTVYVWFKDYAGNISGPAINTIEMTLEDYINNTGNAIYGEIFFDDQMPSDTAPVISSYNGHTKIICMQDDILKNGVRSGIVKIEYGYKLHSAAEYTWVDTAEIKGINTTNTYDFVTRVTDAAGNTTLSKVTTTSIEESTVPKIELIKVYNLSTYNPAYIKQSDRVQITFKAITSDYANNSLTVDDIIIKVGDKVITPSQKTLSAGTETGDGIVWNLTLSGISDNGLLTLIIPENKVVNSGNVGNLEALLDTKAIVDNIAPAGTIIINDNDEITQAINVTLTLEADGADFMYISNDLAAPGEFNPNWEEYVTSKSHALIGERGVNTVYAWFKDLAGNISVYASDTIEVNALNDTIQSSIFLDTQAPSDDAPAISATNNDVKVVSNQVDIYKDGVRSGIAKIEYGYKLFGSANAYTYQSSDVIKNISQNEEYEFVTRATDNAGNITESLPTVILIEKNTAPIFKLDYKKNVSTSNVLYAKAADILEFKISATSARYNNNSTLEASDINIYVGGVKISDVEKDLSVIETTGNGQSWKLVLTNVTGNGELFIEIPADKAFDVDSNGNVNTVLETGIIVDNIKPLDNSISLANGAEKTKIQNVLANISSVGADYMYVSNEQIELTEFSEEWIEYTNLKYHNLTDGYGEKTVYAWFKDEAGNISEMVSDTIIYEVNENVIEDEIFLDTIPPTDDAPSILVSTYAQIICNQDDPYSDGGFKSGIANIEYGYRVNGSSDDYTWQASAILTHVPAIDYYEFVTKATDAAGNTTVSKPTVEYIDITQIYVDVIFDAGEGTVSPRVKSYVYGGNYTDLPIAVSSQSGFEFEGWYTKENGLGTKVTEETVITNQYCHTLYANYKDSKRGFITKWTIPAGGDTITLPIPLNGANNYTVDWGDGTFNTYDVTADFPTHEYTNTEQQTFEISITGTVMQFGYHDWQIPQETGDLSKYYTFTKYLTGIKQWGELNVAQIGFANCTNLSGTLPSPTEKSFENAIHFLYAFYECRNLTGNIPSDLFKNAVRVTTYGSTFAGCSGLTGTIPADLFKDSPNVEGFYNTFKYCTGLEGPIPGTLFSSNRNVISFGMTFEGCSNLTGEIPVNLFTNNTLAEDFSSTFSDCAELSGSIPATLFASNNKVKSFEKTFAGCKKLTGTIPENLFVAAGENVKSFAQTFIQCDGLSGAIPAGLFAANPNVTSFFYTFAYADNFTSVPAGLFDNNVAITTNNNKSQGFAQTFLACIGLKSAVVDSRFVGYKMFYGCNNLTEITVTNNVEAIYLPAGSEGAFRYYGSNPAILETTLYTTNEVAQKYDWAADNRAVNSNSMVVTFTPSSNATWSKVQSTVVKVVDDLSGVDEASLKYQWTQSTTAPTEASFTQSFTNESEIIKNTDSGNNWYLWVLAKNLLGKTLIVRSNEFYLDNNLPSVTVTAEGSTYGSNYILNVKDTHSGVVGWQVTDSSSMPTEWNTIAMTNDSNISYRATKNGTHYAWVKDAAGNVGSAMVFTVDLSAMTAPRITAKMNNYTGSNYVAGTVTKNNIALELTSDYAGDVAYYEWSVNETTGFSTEGLQTTNTGIGRMILDTEMYETIYFRAVDDFGNYSDVSQIELKIDKTAPVGDIYIIPIYEDVDKYTNSNTVSINVNASDNYSNEANISIALINEEDFDLNNSNDSISWISYEAQKSWELTAGNGLRKVYILIKDEAGNQSTYLKTY